MLYGKAVLRIRGILYGAGSVHWITDTALDPDPYGRYKISCHLRSHKKV
jgi:hypothetical protein